MEQQLGQAPEQPAAPATAFDGFLKIAQSEERPRDEQGKFKSLQPEAPTEEAKPKEEAPKEEQTETPPEEAQPEITPETRKFKLKYKGEEMEKEEPEVIELAQKGFDYTQKSQALAKEREDSAARLKAEAEAARKSYEDQLEIHRQAVLKLADPEAMSADLNKLAEQDPARAQQLFFKRLQINQTLQGIAQEQMKVAEQRKEESEKSFKKQVTEANEVLAEKIPGWGNETYQKILDAAKKEYGYKAEEVNAFVDPRAIQVLYDAMQYRAAKAKPLAEKKSAPPTPKVVKPGSGEKPDAKAEEIAKLREKFKKSGRREDAVPIFQRILSQDG